MVRKEFERVSPESVGIPSGAIERLLDKLESGYTEPHGLMIMRGGKICAEGWWAPYAPGIRHGLQSHTKTYAATAVGIAVTEGFLSLDERVIDIFPQFAPENPSENLKKLTVHHVLCMGCGMRKMPRPTEDWIKQFLAIPVEDEPGTAFMYNSTGSTLLGAIVRQKTGLGLHDYLKPRLYDKIGIDADNLRYYCMPDGMEVGGGGMFATTEDNLRLMKLYADGGVWEGERILSEEYVQRAINSQNDSSTEAKGNPLAYDNFVGYGYQIWRCRPEGIYRADGAMGQFTVVIPDREMLISITETAPGSDPQITLDNFWQFLDEIPKCPAEPIEADEEAAAALKKRMASLTLPKPVYAPHSPMKAKVSGRDYDVTQGRLHFGDSVGVFMGGERAPEGISSFRFDFDGDLCTMTFLQEGEEKQLTVALHGDYAHNRLEGSVLTRVLTHGAWLEENVFRLNMRWIESCFERKYNFIFSGDSVRIEQVGAERLLFMGAGGPVEAVAR